MEIKINYDAGDGRHDVTVKRTFWSEEQMQQFLDYNMHGERHGYAPRTVEVPSPVREIEVTRRYQEDGEVVRLAVLGVYNSGTPSAKIYAIKLLRYLWQMGLKEAKDQVENWAYDDATKGARECLGKIG